MKLIAQLEELLYQAQHSPRSKELQLMGWRTVVNESRAVSLGVKDNLPGGVYTPPSYHQGESGEVFLVWADGKCSQSRVQYLPGQQKLGENELSQWRLAAYEDPDASEIPRPEALPLVAVEDRELQKIVTGSAEKLFEQLGRWLEAKPRDAKIQGNIQGVWGYRHLRTSTGLAVTYQQSQYMMWVSINSLVGAGWGKRRIILPNEEEMLWQRLVEYYSFLQHRGPEIIPGTKVIFTPAVVEEMVGQFILPNLMGENVLNGQSAWEEGNFRAGRVVFDSQLSLVLDPLRPLEWGSYLVTAEGVPARRSVLVQNGSLQTPILRLKDAKRWGGEATALPHGTSGLYVYADSAEDWLPALESIDDGVLILSVLGLHTQNAVTGDYSLSAPQALRIKQGKIMGRIDVKLNGNFFQDMASAQTRYARTELDTYPGMILQTGIQAL